MAHPARTALRQERPGPHLSKGTFDYHYAKHHNAYVVNRVTVAGRYENLSIEETSRPRPVASTPPGCGTTPSSGTA